MNAFSEKAMRDELRRACVDAGSGAAWARRNGLSTQFVCDVLAGRRSVSASLAARLGYQRRTIFEKGVGHVE